MRNLTITQKRIITDNTELTDEFSTTPLWETYKSICGQFVVTNDNEKYQLHNGLDLVIETENKGLILDNYVDLMVEKYKL